LVATVRVIVDEVKRRHVDPLPLLRTHGLDEAPLWSPYARVPRGAVLCFVEDCLRALDDPALHVAATAAAEIGAFHLVDYLALLAPTWGAGAGAIMDRFHLVNGGCAFFVDKQPEVLTARFTSLYEPRPHPIEVECTFVAVEGRMRVATEGRYGLASVDLAHRDDGTGERLAAAMPCPVRFEQTENRISFERAAWDFSPQFFSAASRSIVQAAFAPFAAAVNDEDLVRAARVAVAEDAGNGPVSLRRVARRLGLSQRSLQRRLAEKGTSFAKMVDQELQEQALRRITEPGARASEVAYALGFSEASAFTRAFRRWTGMSPTEYSARHRRPGHK
jgi:AraC-like DNA-binding protein